MTGDDPCPWCSSGEIFVDCPRHPLTGNEDVVDSERRDDSARLDWLGADWARLEDIRGLLRNEEVFSIREAIDKLRGAQ